MGYKFSLILSRTLTKDEVVTLRDAGCSQATFGTDTLPTNAAVTVARLDFDDLTSPSLAAAIDAGLEAVKKVPDLSVPGLNVPAQPAHPPTIDAESSAVSITSSDDVVVDDKDLAEAAVTE